MATCPRCRKATDPTASRWRVGRRTGDHCSALCAVLSDRAVTEAVAELAPLLSGDERGGDTAPNPHTTHTGAHP